MVVLVLDQLGEIILECKTAFSPIKIAASNCTPPVPLYLHEQSGK